MKVSKTTRRDPSGTSKLRRDYEAQLIALFRKLKGDVRSYFDSGSRILEERALLSGASPDSILKINNIIMKTVVVPAKQITVDNSTNACAQGALKASILLKQVGVDVAPQLTTLDMKLVNIIQLRNYSALNGITDEMGKKIANVLTDDIIKGEGADQMARDINNEVDIGITRARTMARTETMYAYNTTATERYKAHGIEEEEWLTTEDERTCDICGPLDGQRFPVGEQDCPIHPNCRCVKLPVLPEAS